MTTQYKKFMKLIAKWPLDSTKGDRDLGKVIREKVKIAFDPSNKQNLNTELCNRQYDSLYKIADNHYLNKYKRTRISSATGLGVEDCKSIISDEILAILNKQKKNIFYKIFQKD